jgi:predicted metalloprotease with PDZ domain
MLADCLKAGDLFIKSIVVTQDTSWGAQSKDLWGRSQVLINAIPGEKTALLADVKELITTSLVFKESLPLEVQYFLRLADRPSGLIMGVESFSRDPFYLLVVRPNGFASKIGLYAGDRIISVGDKVFRPTGSLEEFKLLIKENLGQKLQVVVERSGKQETITLKIPKEIPKEYLINP